MAPAALDLGDLAHHLVEHQVVATIQKFGPPQDAAFALVGMQRGLISEEAMVAHAPNLRAEAVARVMLWARMAWDKATGLFMPREYREARERLHDRDLTDFRPVEGGEPVVVMDGRELPLAEAVRRAMTPALPSRIVVPELPAPTPAPPEPQPAPKKAAVLPLPPIPKVEDEDPEPAPPVVLGLFGFDAAKVDILRATAPVQQQRGMGRKDLAAILDTRAPGTQRTEQQPRPQTNINPAAIKDAIKKATTKVPSVPQEPSKDQDLPDVGGGGPKRNKIG